MITLGQDRGHLFWQLRIGGKIQREYIGLADTRDNRRGLKVKVNRLNLEWANGSLDIEKEFPAIAAKLGLAMRNPTVRQYWDGWLGTLQLGKATRYDYECLGRRFLGPDSGETNDGRTKLRRDPIAVGSGRDESIGDHQPAEAGSRIGIGHLRLADLTASQLRAVIEGAGIRRAVMFLQKLRSMYDAAMRDELVGRNPAKLVQNPKDRHRREPLEPLTRDEVTKILEAASESEPKSKVGRRTTVAQRSLHRTGPRSDAGLDYALIVTMLGTGVRPGEALALRAAHVDLKRGRLIISGSIGRYGEGTTKNEGSRRIVELTNRVAPVIPALTAQMRGEKIVNLRLAERLAGVRRSGTATVESPSQPPADSLETLAPVAQAGYVKLGHTRPLFANERGGFLQLANWRDRHWRKILEAAKVSYRSPLVCRHTYAVRMLEAGFDVVYVAGQMGHTSTAMVFRNYARWTNKEAVAK